MISSPLGKANGYGETELAMLIKNYLWPDHDKTYIWRWLLLWTPASANIRDSFSWCIGQLSLWKHVIGSSTGSIDHRDQLQHWVCAGQIYSSKITLYGVARASGRSPFIAMLHWKRDCPTQSRCQCVALWCVKGAVLCNAMRDCWRSSCVIIKDFPHQIKGLFWLVTASHCEDS